MKSRFQLFRRLLGCLIIAMFAMSIMAPCFAASVENPCSYSDVSCAGDKKSSSQDDNASDETVDHCCAMHISKAHDQTGFVVSAFSRQMDLMPFIDSLYVENPLQGFFRPPQA